MNNAEELKIKENIDNDGGYVYIVLADDKTVKIGITKHPYTRINQIETASGKEIINWHFSKVCSNYKDIETKMHKYFKNNRLKGEWFNISYGDAKNYLKNFKCESVTQSSNSDEIIRQVKIIQLCNVFASIEHKEYNYKKLKYNRDIYDDRHIKDETLEVVKDEIFKHYEYNKKEMWPEDNFVQVYIDYIKNGDVKRAVIEYCIDFMDLGADEEMLRAEGLYDIYDDVLKFKIVEGNYLADDVCEKILNEMYLEYGKDFVNKTLSENF